MTHARARTRRTPRLTVLASLLAVLAVACGPRFDRTELVVAGEIPAGDTSGGASTAVDTDGDGTADTFVDGSGELTTDGSLDGSGTEPATDPGADAGADGATAGDAGGTDTGASGDAGSDTGGDAGTAQPGGAQQQSQQSSVDPGPQPGITDDTIKIGYLVPLTGAAPIPTSWDDGANLYWDVKNKAGGINGRKVQLIIEDTESSTTTAVNKARKLITQDKVFTIITLDRLEVQEAVARELEARNFPHIMIQSPTPPPPSWKNTFTISIDHTVQGRSVARFWKKELASVGNEVGVVREQTNALKPGADAMVAEAKAQGLKVVAQETIDPNSADFTQTILRLQQSGAKIVWLYMAPTPAARIISQAGASGYQPTWFANSISWNFELMHGVTASYMDGHAYAFSPWVALSDPRTANYKKAWAACGGCSGNADDIGLVGWGVGGVLDAALSKPGRALGHDSFRAGLKGFKVNTDVWAPVDCTTGSSICTQKVAVYRSQGGSWKMSGDFRSF